MVLFVYLLFAAASKPKGKPKNAKETEVPQQNKTTVEPTLKTEVLNVLPTGGTSARLSGTPTTVVQGLKKPNATIASRLALKTQPATRIGAVQGSKVITSLPVEFVKDNKTANGTTSMAAKKEIESQVPTPVFDYRPAALVEDNPNQANNLGNNGSGSSGSTGTFESEIPVPDLKTTKTDTTEDLTFLDKQSEVPLPDDHFEINPIIEDTGANVLQNDTIPDSSLETDVPKLKPIKEDDPVVDPFFPVAIKEDEEPVVIKEDEEPVVNTPGSTTTEEVDPIVDEDADPIQPVQITQDPKEPPIVKDPIVKEPVVEEPPVKELVVEDPPVKEPVVEEPPVVKEPVVEEPPVVKEPVVEEPPVVKEPVVEEPPVVKEPVVEEPPVIKEPVVEEPPIANTTEPVKPVKDPFFIEEPKAPVFDTDVPDKNPKDPIVAPPIVENPRTTQVKPLPIENVPTVINTTDTASKPVPKLSGIVPVADEVSKISSNDIGTPFDRKFNATSAPITETSRETPKVPVVQPTNPEQVLENFQQETKKNENSQLIAPNPSSFKSPEDPIFEYQDDLAGSVPPAVTYPDLPDREDINLVIPDSSRPNGLPGEDLNPAYLFPGLQPKLTDPLIPHTLEDASLLFFKSTKEKFIPVDQYTGSSSLYKVSYIVLILYLI